MDCVNACVLIVVVCGHVCVRVCVCCTQLHSGMIQYKIRARAKRAQQSKDSTPKFALSATNHAPRKECAAELSQLALEGPYQSSVSDTAGDADKAAVCLRQQEDGSVAVRVSPT